MESPVLKKNGKEDAARKVPPPNMKPDDFKEVNPCTALWLFRGVFDGPQGDPRPENDKTKMYEPK